MLYSVYILSVELCLTHHIQCVKRFHFLRQNLGVFPYWGDTSSFIGPNFLLNLVQRTVFSVHGAPTRSLAIQIRRAQTTKYVVTVLSWKSFHHINCNTGSNANWKYFATEYIYRGRDENKGIVSALSAGAHTATLYVMVTRVKGGGGAPHPQQPGLNFPSWWNVRQKSAIATLFVLCVDSHISFWEFP